jgi:hypothetical protein
MFMSTITLKSRITNNNITRSHIHLKSPGRKKLGYKLVFQIILTLFKVLYLNLPQNRTPILILNRTR